MMDTIPAVIGVDVGKDGFICLMPETGDPEFLAMPMIVPAGGKGKRRYDVATLVRRLRDWNARYFIRLVAVEKQQPYRGQGVSSTFSIGEGYGLMQGVVTAMGLPMECPHPRTWQAVMTRDVPGSDPKARSIEAAGRLFPRVDLRPSEHPLCKPSHNKADALLIAAWAARKMGGV